MSKIYNVSSSPHIKDTSSTQTIMRDVCISLIPVTLYGAVHFGEHALIVIILTVLSCVLSELVWEKLMRLPVTIGDYSAAVTGLILALNLPPEVPYWIPVLGGVFAIIVVKQLYGGLGQNFMNPALAARCFLLISFARNMTDLTSYNIGFDGVSSATPLAIMKSGGNVDISDLIFGNIPGSIGEVSAILLLIGAVYLLLRKVITFRIPLTYILSFALFVFIFGKQDLYYVGCQIFAGGLMFGAFFMADDYVTSPMTIKGQYVYAVFLGIITGIFRLWGASAEGVSYAILLGNLVTPLIERVTLPEAFGREGRKK